MKKLSFGLLDFGYRSSDVNSMVKLNDVISYSMQAEKLGFDRFWVGEHHTSEKTLSWNNPMNLIPVLASHTQSIKIGAAGMLMSIHNPYHVASFYKFFNNVYPKRIELGFANGKPYDSVSYYSTGKPSQEAISLFDQNASKTVRLLKEDEKLFQDEGIVIPPYKGFVPEIWTLGSSEKSRAQALELGTGLCLWDTYKLDAEQKDILLSFKEAFYNRHKRYPLIQSVFNLVCHPSTKKAKTIATDQNVNPNIIVGNESRVFDLLSEYSHFYDIHHFILYNAINYIKDRLIGIEMISNKFQLISGKNCLV